MKLHENIVIGAASASYQIEGAIAEDGKGKSIWDSFVEVKGNIDENENGVIACDSYHLYEEDVKCMKEMGLEAYRFSISWSRVIPQGKGDINEEGLLYYERLIDLLLSNGIEPYVTLYHWDLPQALEDKGGWENRSTSLAFESYAKLISRRFNGKVKNYFTINEPQCVVQMGYHSGKHAPGKKLSAERATVCAHNVLLAHGLAVRAIRETSTNDVRIGIASTGVMAFPQDETSLVNVEASYQMSFITDYQGYVPFSFFNHPMFLDPIFLGHYPKDVPDNIQTIINGFDKEDFDIISSEIDVLGVNIYNGIEVDEKGIYIPRYQGYPRTSLKWPITPQVMKWGLKHLYRRYKTPVIISENGQSCNDRIYSDGKVHDLDRIDTLQKYLESTMMAVEDGVDVKGYFHWSLTDNFEWAEGYAPRFGLVFIDYLNQDRIIKDSGRWIRDVIKQRSIISVNEFIRDIK